MQTTRRSFFQWAAGLFAGAAAAPAVARSVVETDEADFRTPFDKDDDVWVGIVDNLENPCDTDDERLTAMQRALLESRDREVMISGERACGKTHALMRWMAQKVKDTEVEYSLNGSLVGGTSNFRSLVLVDRDQCEYASAMLIESLNRLNVGCKFDRMVGGIRTPSGARVVFGWPEDLQRFKGYLFGAAAIDTSEPTNSAHYVQLLYALRHPVGRAITKVDHENRTVTMSDIPEKRGQVAMTREAAPNRGAFGVSGDAEWIKSVNISFALVNGFGKDKLPRQQRYCRTDHFTTDGFTPETFIDLGYRNWLVRKRARSV